MGLFYPCNPVLSWLFCQLSLVPWFRRTLSGGGKASWPCMVGWFWPPLCRTIWTTSRCSFPSSLSVLKMRTSITFHVPEVSSHFSRCRRQYKPCWVAPQVPRLYRATRSCQGARWFQNWHKGCGRLEAALSGIMGICLSHSGAMSIFSLTWSWELQRPGPFSSHALGDIRWFLWTLGNDLHPEPYPVFGIARVEAAGPFFSHTCGNEWHRQPVEHYGQEDHQDKPPFGFLQGWHLDMWATLACHAGRSSGSVAAQSLWACTCWQCDIVGCSRTGLCDVTTCCLPGQQAVKAKMQLGRTWVDGFWSLSHCNACWQALSLAVEWHCIPQDLHCELCPDSIQAAFSAVLQLGSHDMFPHKILLRAKWQPMLRGKPKIHAFWQKILTPLEQGLGQTDL